jgi:hypothetical protein
MGRSLSAALFCLSLSCFAGAQQLVPSRACLELDETGTLTLRDLKALQTATAPRSRGGKGHV